MSQTAVNHVKKKDLVQVTVGAEKGKTGKVLRIDNKYGRVVIEKLNLVKKHKKPTGKTPGGIVELEAPIPASNVLLFCDKCGKGVRTRRQKLESGKSVRICRKCNAELDKA